MTSIDALRSGVGVADRNEAVTKLLGQSKTADGNLGALKQIQETSADKGALEPVPVFIQIGVYLSSLIPSRNLPIHRAARSYL
jgi:hypothetical protein